MVYIRFKYNLFLLILLCWSCNQEYNPGLDPKAQGTKNVYTNERFGYTVSYPDHWFPSGIEYANAFELRNYDPVNPQSLLEKNRASVIIVDTVSESAEVTHEFLDSLVPEGGGPEHRKLIIDGHRAVRVHRKVPAQLLGPGISSGLVSETAPAQPDFFYSISTYIANGKNLISIEASAPVEADSLVIEEIIEIEESVIFH